MAKVYFERMKVSLHEIFQEHCDRCFYDSQSQRHHICLTRDNREALETHFIDMIDRINEEEANKICADALKSVYGESENFYVTNKSLKIDLEWQKEVKDLFEDWFKQS